MSVPPADFPKREPAEKHRIEKDLTGLSVVKIVLTRAFFQCSHCSGMFPADMVGLRYVAASQEIRNQPRCTQCRSYSE